MNASHHRSTGLSACFLLLLGALSAAPPAHAVTPTELFFSEYIEGSSFNKAIEIYNGTGATVDLSAYDLELYSNGAGSPSQSVALVGMLADGDVFVVSRTNADAALLAVADQFSNAVVNWNGNDAIVLRKAGAVIDAFGQVGVNPGSSWPGGPSTQNNTIRRRPDVCRGDTDDSDPFSTLLQWNGFGNDVFAGFGSHSAHCDVPPVPELLLSEIVVTFTEKEFIEIYNPNGAAVDLTNVYVTDATHAGSGFYYYNLPTGANTGGGSVNDFYAQFPLGATIGSGEYQTIAMNSDFTASYGVAPTYELCDSSGAPDMLEALPGSIACNATLTNTGEVVVLLEWDRSSDLVTDLDYVLWGDKAEAVDKTGVSILGSSYLPDTPIGSQDVIDSGQPHDNGESSQRDDLSEGNETMSGGNGAGGHDETSEDLSVTWCVQAPTPNLPNLCHFCGDGVVDPGEECDDGNNIDGDGCQADCTLPRCGDGILDPGEGCDDGNNIDLDGCSAACRPEGACCSNGPWTETECFITNDVDCFDNHSLYLGDGAECTADIDCFNLAATFESFSATATGEGVVIRWVTALEVDVVGFRVLREVANGREKRVGVVAEMVLAAGFGTTGASYEILDAAPEAAFSTVYYIEDVDIFGKATRHGPIMIDRGAREQPAVREAGRRRRR